MERSPWDKSELLQHDLPSIHNLANVPASKKERGAALVLACALILSTIVVAALGNVRGPVIPAFFAIMTSATGLAALLTAYLLMSQFLATGMPLLAAAASGYAIFGLVSLPNLMALPGIENTQGYSISASVWLWAIWHTAFPGIIAIWLLLNGDADETVLQPRLRASWMARWVAGTAAFALIVDLGPFTWVRYLPPLSDERGVLSPLWYRTVPLTIALATVFSAYALLRRSRYWSVMHVWLSVSLLANLGDAFLGTISEGRFTASWYLAKVEALLAMGMLLVVLLGKVGSLYREAAERAATDELTQLPNRRSGFNHLDWVLDYCARQGELVGVLMIDVDEFKAYNDTYGHVAGDVCLKAIATALQSSGRSTDIFARYGGEELLGVLPAAGAEGTKTVGERARASVERLAIPHVNSHHGRVTISVGGAFGKAGTVDREQLIAAADAALYHAKNSGRNRVIVDPCASSREVPAAGIAGPLPNYGTEPPLS